MHRTCSSPTWIEDAPVPPRTLVSERFLWLYLEVYIWYLVHITIASWYRRRTHWLMLTHQVLLLLLSCLPSDIVAYMFQYRTMVSVLLLLWTNKYPAFSSWKPYRHVLGSGIMWLLVLWTCGQIYPRFTQGSRTKLTMNSGCTGILCVYYLTHVRYCGTAAVLYACVCMHACISAFWGCSRVSTRDEIPKCVYISECLLNNGKRLFTPANPPTTPHHIPSVRWHGIALSTPLTYSAVWCSISVSFWKWSPSLYFSRMKNGYWMHVCGGSRRVERTV